MLGQVSDWCVDVFEVIAREVVVVGLFGWKFVGIVRSAVSRSELC